MNSNETKKVEETNWNTSGPLSYTTLDGKKVTTWVDRDLCIGAATCIALAPLTFNLDDEAKAIYLETATQETLEQLMDGAMSCPVAAVFVVDEDGKRLYPEE